MSSRLLLFCTCRGPCRGRVRHRGGGAPRRDALVLRGQSGLVLDGLVEGGLAHVPHVVLPRVRVVSDTPVKMMPLLLIAGKLPALRCGFHCGIIISHVLVN